MGSDDREVSEEEPEIIDLEGQGTLDKNGCPRRSMWDGDGHCEVYTEENSADPGDSPFSSGYPPSGDASDSRPCCPCTSCAARLMAKDEKTGKWKCICPGLGLLYTVFSAFFFSSSHVLVKKIEDIHSVEISAIRCVFQMLFVLPGLIYYKLGFLGPKNQRIFLFLRGFLGSTAMILQYYAVQSMPLADATVITFSSPAFTCIFACIFLKEKCTVWDIVFMLLTITGVVLVARPPFLFGSLNDGLDEEYSNHMKGAIAAVGSAVGASLTIVVLRKMGKSVHYLLSIWYYAIIGLIESVIAMFVIGAWSLPKCGLDRWLLVFIGLLGLGGQTFLVKALQIEKAGPVAVMRTMDVVFAFIFQALILHRIPSWLTIGGALCIVASTAGTAIVKWYTSSREGKKSEL
ncbi:solute carrier family 35 member G1 [Dendropsophus ebraccatus]|uniref:solute carrier family 35 member G1 n=1 Tax=Dendropsophus ebraccatus TaxID=150705 RepID=UPI00383134C1